MVMTRRVDSEATALQRQGELGLWASCLGQEAAQIGSAARDGGQDFVFPTYREHGVAWCQGIDPVELLALFRGTDLGGWDTQGASLPPLHDRHRVADAARGRLRDGRRARRSGRHRRPGARRGGDRLSRRRGDQPGRCQRGVGLRVSSYNAPIVFFCQNNQWAISEPIERQSRIPLYKRAAGFGFPGVRVDGNDVLAMHAVTSEALERARSGNGPTFIEAYTYRMGAHTTSDDPTKYRLADELEHWRLKDPIERVRAYLTRTGSGGRGLLRRASRPRRPTCRGSSGPLPGPPRPSLRRVVRRRVCRRQTPLLERAAGRLRRLPGQLRGSGAPGSRKEGR